MPKQKKIKGVKGWGIFDSEFGLVHYIENNELRFFRYKKEADKEAKIANKGYVIPVQILPLKVKKNKKK